MGILCDLYNYIDINIPSDLAIWCSFLVAFYCLFRKANVAPRSLQNFNSAKELSRRKFAFLENDEIVLVYSNFSKTNQFMNRESVIPLIKNSNPTLDPVFHLKKLFQSDIPSDKPTFSYIDNGVIKCVTYNIFTRKLKS